MYNVYQTIVWFAQLEELYLGSNKLSRGLNPAIGRLRQLKKLFLMKCELPYLPECIAELELVCIIMAMLFLLSCWLVFAKVINYGLFYAKVIRIRIGTFSERHLSVPLIFPCSAAV